MDEQPWMSKDLLVRLRWWAFKFCGKGEQENLASDAMSEAASRIEKLETALRFIAGPSTVEFVDGTYEISETKMLGTYRKVAKEALEGKDV
jgi:hypothetical protein